MITSQPSYANGFAPRDGTPLFASLSVGCVGNWSPELGPTGTVLYDWSPGRNHGTLTSMSPVDDWHPDQGKWALDFDGTNDYVALNATVTAYPFSVSCWWYPTDMTVYSTLFSISASSTSDRRWTMEMRNNTESNVLALTAQQAPTYSQTNSTASCVANRWQHCCAVFASATSRTIYLNGGNSATGTTSVTPTGIDRMAIGRLQTAGAPSGTNYAKGMIGDVRLYNRVLTQAEILLLSTRRGIANEIAPLGAIVQLSTTKRTMQPQQLAGVV